MSKKILLVSRCAWTLYNFRSGLMRALKGRGHIVMGGGAAGDGFEARVEELGVSFTGLPVDKRGINPWADLRLFWALYRWYTGQKPDIVHHFTSKPVIYGSVAARLAKVPRIVNTITGLGSVFTGQKTTWLRRLVELMYRFSMRFAHVTFFQNQEDLHFFLSRGLVRAGRARLLPGSGIDCKRFVPEPRNGCPFTFLMVARLLKDKGVYQFVEAARLTKRRFPETRFQLLGGRDIRNPTVVPEADLLKWQSQQVVTWLGEVEDVRPVIARADVLVLPSHYREGVPRSLLEGAAMGKPLIATDSTGCREVVEHEVNGLLVPVKDAAALADAMAWMLENSEKRVLMGKAGRRKAEEEFDESIVLEQTLKVYEAETL
jgi:glycosyltransferase involved in cell wall biosynthesis